MIDIVRKYITESFTKDGKPSTTIKHSIRVADWVKTLRPNADEAMIIAALAHDIQRAFVSDKDKVNKYAKLRGSKAGFADKEFLENHQKHGAEIIGEFLEKNGACPELIERVKMLVSKHEVGGNEDQNLLKDADSLSFFENNIDHFLNNIIHLSNYQMIKDKFDWMYNRISSEKARKIAEPWYLDAIKRLG